MKMAMKIAAVFIFVVGAASPAWAQFNSWGTGMWGANQACNQPYRVAAGSSSELDGVREAQNEISKAERELRKKKTELKKMERDLERARSDIENSVASEFSDFVFEHIENGRSCGAYDGAQGDVGACGENEPGCVAH
ncbi:MAG TPA: hypothetical protein PL182_02895, partial [Pseudobdellovibrionaceae bacterium]|nr:hypothetical protein [Pseudobdellovibrionaceae bacterium]